MADAKVTSLSALTAVTGDDVLYVVDDPGGTPASKKATAAVLRDYTNMVVASGTDAATTCAANTFYTVDMSAWATADRNYTMPASPAVGDRVGIFVTSGNASYELIIKGNTSQTINGGSAASEWSRLFIRNECVVLRYTASNTWVVEYDGRIPCVSAVQGTYTVTASGSAQQVTFTSTEEKINVGNVSTNSNERMYTARRLGNVKIGTFGSFSASASGRYLQMVVRINGSGAGLPQPTVWSSTTATFSIGGSMAYVLALNDYLDLTAEQNDSTSEVVTYNVFFEEILV